MLDVVFFLITISLLGVKFLAGLGMIWANDFTFFQSVLIAIGGGMLGVLIFSYGFDLNRKIWSYYYPNNSKIVKFSKRKRLLVNLRKRIGLIGISLLTPIFLTVPVGTVLANTIEKNRMRVFYYMLLSFSIWSLGLNGIYKLTGLDLNGYLKSFF
jgi:hypothetical protein